MDKLQMSLILAWVIGIPTVVFLGIAGVTLGWIASTLLAAALWALSYFILKIIRFPDTETN